MKYRCIFPERHSVSDMEELLVPLGDNLFGKD